MPVPSINPESPTTGEPEQLGALAVDAIVDRGRFDEVLVQGEGSAKVIASNAAFEGSLLAGAGLMGSKLQGIACVDCRFDRADLANASWTDGRFVRTAFNECRLTGFDGWGSQMRDVRFVGCKGPDAIFTRSSCTRVRFDGCQLAGMDLSESQIDSLAIHDCDARNLRLIGSRISFLDLRGSLIDGIVFDIESLKGIVIDPSQAGAIARSLGVRVEAIEPIEQRAE